MGGITDRAVWTSSWEGVTTKEGKGKSGERVGWMRAIKGCGDHPGRKRTVIVWGGGLGSLTYVSIPRA